jgi:hypothetical protein
MPLVLVAVLCVLWLLTVGHRHRLGLGALSVRGALVVAFLMFEVLVLLVTEVTSVGGHFTSISVGVAWGVLLLLLLILARPLLVRLITGWAGTSGRLQTIGARLRILGVEDALWLTAILAIFGILAAIGWLYPPNNGDSMVYHLARVEHWIQNGSVAPFATHYLAQIELSPLHEYNLANLHLLFGSDRLDGYVQLLAALICVVGASEMARMLGGSRWVQIAAAVLCVTIPSGILEATSTENNYFAAAIGIALLLILIAWTVGRGWIPRAVGIGFAGGLVVLAKGTLLALIGPGVVVLALLALRKEWRAGGAAVALRRCLATGAIAITCAVAVAGPFELQNAQLFGGPLGPVSKSTLSTHLGPGGAAANVIRSTAGDFLGGGGPGELQTDIFKVLLKPLQAAFSRLHVSPSDQNYALGTRFRAFTVHDNSFFSRSEDYGANPWHVLLLLFTGIALLVALRRGSRQLRTPLLLAVGLCCGYLFFTATARWSVFNVRYQLPLIVAWCPLIAVVLGRARRVAGRLVLIALLIACTPQLFDNAARSLIHPTYTFSAALAPYFPPAAPSDNGGPGSALGAGASAYGSLTDSIAQSSCKRVGLANWVLVEYPIWVGVHHDGWTGTIEDVDVMNQTQQLEITHYPACAWIRQEGPDYVAPDDGNVHLQFGNLALSVRAFQAATITTRIPGFTSTASGVRILPGGGWSLEGSRGLGVMQTGSLYLYSSSPQRVGIMMRVEAGTPQLSASVEGASVNQIPVTPSPGVVGFSIQLQTGMTSLSVSSGASSGSPNHGLELTDVTVVNGPALVPTG